MKYLQNQFAENYKTIMKYSKESLSKFRATHCLSIRIFTIVRVSIFAICCLDAIQSHSNSTQAFFCKYQQADSQTHLKR